MDHLYAFYDSVTDKETFHIQCEWMNKTINLDDSSIDQETDYAIVTITDLVDYWQCSITHGLLVKHFKVSNALSKEQRNDALTAAFLGQTSLNGSKLEWRVSRSDEKLQMKLRTFDGDVAFAAGFFLLDKVSKEKAQELFKLWFRNSSLASRKSTEINQALQQRTSDIEKTNTELKETVDSMRTRESKNKYIMIDKFVRLLNEKKRKVFLLQAELKKRPRTDHDEPQERHKKRIKKNPTPVKKEEEEEKQEVAVKIPTQTLNTYSYEEEDSDDELEFTQTVK